MTVERSSGRTLLLFLPLASRKECASALWNDFALVIVAGAHCWVFG